MKIAPGKSEADPGHEPEALTGPVLAELLEQFASGWTVVEQHYLERRFGFPDFRQALDFINQVGLLAEEQQHPPDIYLGGGEVRLQLWTREIDALSVDDFILAARISSLAKKLEIG